MTLPVALYKTQGSVHPQKCFTLHFDETKLYWITFPIHHLMMSSAILEEFDKCS